MSVTVTQKGTDGWSGQSIRIHLEKRVFTCELGQAILDNNGQKTFDCSPECDGGDTCCTSSNKCGEGEGDCDADADCQSGLICGKDNCVGKNFDATDDCCMK